MIALLWLVALMLSCVALVYGISALVVSVRGNQTHFIILSLFGLGVMGTALWVHQPLVIAGRTLILAPLLLVILSLVIGWTSAMIVGRVSSSKAQAGQLVKLSSAHLFLILGSLMFLIPFAWLISTSLKTDAEMAVFPPVWIPHQQITSPQIKDAQGKPALLSYWREADPKQKIEVAEVEQLPSGDVRVQKIADSGAPSGEPFVTPREQLTIIPVVSPRWQNYSEALAFLPPESHYGLTFLKNTLTITLLSVLGTVLSSSLVAYSFARLQWPGKNTLFVMLLATLMVPGAVTLMPQFLIFRSLGWIDTLLPLWVPAFFGSAFNIFLLRQFFMSIPGELEDAAKIDGCGPFGIYWRVMLPLVKPALAAIAILATLGAWNNFQGPLIYISSPDKMPLAYALQLYQQDHGGEPGLLMAASTLVVLPIVVLFFFTQRYFIEGASLSGLGGR
jgi:multiple sugar transport system permease protein